MRLVLRQTHLYFDLKIKISHASIQEQLLVSFESFSTLTINHDHITWRYKNYFLDLK